MSSIFWCDSDPYAGQDRTSKYTSPDPSAAAYAWPFSSSVSISSSISGTCPVARGSYVGGVQPSAAYAACSSRSYR